MTIIRKILSILIILLLMFGFFSLLGNPNLTLTGQPKLGVNHISTSVAWLGVCGVFLTYKLVGLFKV